MSRRNNFRGTSFSKLVSTYYSDYLGRVALGRIVSGRVKWAIRRCIHRKAKRTPT